MGWVQTYKPNVKVGGKRGWCLKYVDDAINAPARTPNAAAALKRERAANRIHTTTPPKGVWVIGYLDLTSGRYAKDDHVFLMKYLGNGKYEIRDSETASGARGFYRSVAEIKGWFGRYTPKYVGWSKACDGRAIARYEAPKPVKKPSSKKYYTVRSGDNLSTIAARYKITLGKLLGYPENKKYRANPNRINPKDRVRVK